MKFKLSNINDDGSNNFHSLDSQSESIVIYLRTISQKDRLIKKIKIISACLLVSTIVISATLFIYKTEVVQYLSRVL